MRALILGGYGLIGSYVSARLLRAGWEVTGLTRDPKATRRLTGVRWVAGDIAHMTAERDWAALLDNVAAVVNCAGALQDNANDHLSAVHLSGPSALYRACAGRGIRRIIHISAVGIDRTDTAFARTKRAAEKMLQESDLDWVILRPGLVLAPAVYGGSALIRGLAGFPFVTPLVEPESIVHVVSVEDVAETVVRAVAQDSPVRVTWDLVHPAPTRLRDIVADYRQWLGLSPARTLRVPFVLARAASVCADALAWLGWRSPLRTTSIRQLAAGVAGSSQEWITQSGITPRSLYDIFTDYPSTVQDRWFARAYFVKPLGLAVLCAFWVFSGVLALGPGLTSATHTLQDAGLDFSVAKFAVIAGAVLDILLGLGVAVHRTASIALVGMIAVSIAYLCLGTILTPHLWLDPLGPLAKIGPTIVAALVLRALMDER